MENGTTTGPAEDAMTRTVQSQSLRGWTAILLGVLLVCSTTLLFGAGHGYRLGHFYQLGFDLAQLPADFHETLFWGFAGGTPLLLAWLVATLIALLGSGLLIWFAGVLWERAVKRWRLIRRIAIPAQSPKKANGMHVNLILGGFLVLPVLYLSRISAWLSSKNSAPRTARNW